MYDLEEKRKRFGIAPYLFGALTGVAIGLIVVVAVLITRGQGGEPARRPPANGVQQTAATAGQSLESNRRTAIVIATEKVAPAVVNVTVVRTETYQTRPFFWEDWFNRNWPVRKRKVGGYGSGLIIAPDGFIITNEHVVRNAEDIWVTLPSGEDLKAVPVGLAPNYDLALLKVDAEDLPYAPLGESDGLMVGEWVIAIGSPFGHLLADPHPTVTVGVVSAFHRDVKSDITGERILKDLIQTDAAINPGNSGGPLVNSAGDVVGINAAIFTRSGGSEGIGFAIPAGRARWVVDELRKYGRVRLVYMGLTGMDVNPSIAAAMDLDKVSGVLVRRIYEDGPAYKAGIRAGDLLISINGIELESIEHVNEVVFPARVDDKLRIVIERKGKRHTVTLVLEERPEDI
jgi:S1-C subfamily serine protease